MQELIVIQRYFYQHVDHLSAFRSGWPANKKQQKWSQTHPFFLRESVTSPTVMLQLDIGNNYPTHYSICRKCSIIMFGTVKLSHKGATLSLPWN